MRTIDADELKREICSSQFIRGILACKSESDVYYALAMKIDKQPTVSQRHKKVERPLEWIARNQSSL